MTDYIENMQNMLLSNYSMNEVAENIYLNYHSVLDTDLVYKLRKAIAVKYGCNLNDVKLIGSSHTGYTYKEGALLKRDNPEDYDFAIIDAETFIRFFHMVDLNRIKKDKKNQYMGSILHGKIHPLYANKEFREKLEQINQEIMSDLEITKHVSICFYLSEKDFIDGLVTYNRNLYTGELKRLRDYEKRESSSGMELGDMFDFSTLKGLDKLEE